jgi:hypothetical protein
MTPLMEAHANLTTILESYIASWRNELDHATRPWVEASEVERVPDDKAEGIMRYREGDVSPDQRIKTLRDRLERHTSSTYLVLTQAEIAERSLNELIKMASMTGRLKVIY